MSTTDGKKIVHTDKAPAAIGPYSQAVRIGNLQFPERRRAQYIGKVRRTDSL